MRTRDPDRGLGAVASEVAAHAKSIARLEAKLAIAELKEKARALGVGIGLGVAAAILGLFSVVLLVGTLIAALANFVAVWLSFLIATGACVGLTAVLGVLALQALRRGTPPVPRDAIEDAKLTAEALRNGNGRSAYS
jgi:ethanolamine ammonia-lyase large subunit